MLIMAYACKTSCAGNIVGILPYLPYCKQSKMRKRGCIVSRLLADMIGKAGKSFLQIYLYSGELSPKLQHESSCHRNVYKILPLQLLSDFNNKQYDYIISPSLKVLLSALMYIRCMSSITVYCKSLLTQLSVGSKCQGMCMCSLEYVMQQYIFIQFNLALV